MYVYTLFVSHVNDGFEMGIKSDIEFEWMKSDAEKEGKKTTLWNQFFALSTTITKVRKTFENQFGQPTFI
jgi:hypothetical protein